MISVIIPAYNSESTITRAIASVLSQEDVSIEIIVVDDGSSDKTREAVASIRDNRISYIHQDNAGPSSARNKGAELAVGEYLAFLDSDDEWFSRKLSKQIYLMKSNGLDGCLTDVVEVVDGVGSLDKYKPNINCLHWKELVKMIYRGEVTRNTPTLLICTNLFHRVGGFDDLLKNREDHYILCKAAKYGLLGNLNEVLVYRHLLSSSYSTSYDPVLYYCDTMLFHEKMESDFPFLDISHGVRRTKLVAFKKAIKSGRYFKALSLILKNPSSCKR